MIPFRLDLQSGVPVHEQVAYAAKKAIISGGLKPGDAFPSVRALSKAMKIHANTAQRVITVLQHEGLLEVRPGIGTVVAQPPTASRAERARVLAAEVEQLTVKAIQVCVSLQELQHLIAEQWQKLKPNHSGEKT